MTDGFWRQSWWLQLWSSTSTRRKARRGRRTPGSWFRRRAWSFSKFVLLAAAAPVLWLAYNAAVYRNPLEFANGPYSAKAIEQKTATVNPAKGNLLAAGSYFLKAAELNVAEANWHGPAVAGAGAARKLGGVVRAPRTRRLAAVGSAAVLRAIGGLRKRADFRADVVAVFTLQRALWVATASGVRGIYAAGDFFLGAIRSKIPRFRFPGAAGRARQHC